MNDISILYFIQANLSLHLQVLFLQLFKLISEPHCIYKAHVVLYSLRQYLLLILTQLLISQTLAEVGKH